MPKTTVALPRVEPIVPTLRPHPFNDPAWLFEPQYDGFRVVFYLHHGGCAMYSKRGNRFSRFPELCERILAERPGLGAAYLFPSAESPDRPITKDRAKVWLRKAEKLAKLEHVEWAGFHAFRRKWATERKYLSAVDVAAAGGWVGTETLQRCYQQADEATMLAVVLSGGELRERQA